MAIGQGGSAGVKSYVALFVETTYGTFPATAGTGATTLEPISVGFKKEIASIKLDTLSLNRGFTHHVQTDINAGGTLEQFLHPEESVRLFVNALGGNITSTAGSTGVYHHSITAGDFSTNDTITSLSFLVRKGDTQHLKYTGGRINSMKITANVGEPVHVAYDFIFQDGSIGGSDITATLSTSAILPFTYVQGNFDYAPSEASLTTTAVEHITGFELTVNNNLVSDASVRSLGTNTIVTLPPTRREIEFKITQRFDTTTTYTRFTEHSTGAIKLRFQGASLTAADYYKCELVLPKVYCDTPDVEVGSANDILVSEIVYHALVDDPNTSTGKDIAVTFHNATASY